MFYDSISYVENLPNWVAINSLSADSPGRIAVLLLWVNLCYEQWVVNEP